MSDQPTEPQLEIGVNVFGFDSIEEIIEVGAATLSRRHDVQRRVAEWQREEARRREFPADFLDRLTDAPKPPLWLRRHHKFEDAELVYFVQAENGGPVKIGTTLDHALYKRLTSLQIGNPTPLVLRRLVLGGYTTETTIHSLLHDYWLRGEWFRDEGKVAELIRPGGVLPTIHRAC